MGTPDVSGAPIFIVGSPRSGTTILHNTMRFHPDLAWVTPSTNSMTGFFTTRDMSPKLAFLAARVLKPVVTRTPDRYLPKFLKGPKEGAVRAPGLPKAVEGSRVWVKYLPERDHDHVTAEDAPPEAVDLYRKIVKGHLKLFGGTRFLSKYPINSLRVGWLATLFPDAHWVHILRDGRAAGASIFARKKATQVPGGTEWWGPKPPGWRDLLDEPLAVQSGWIWKTTVDILERDLDAHVKPDHRLRIRYEDFMTRPRDTLDEVFRFCGMDPAPLFERGDQFLPQLRPPEPDKWKRRMTPEEQAQLVDTIHDDLVRWGYPLDDAGTT